MALRNFERARRFSEQEAGTQQHVLRDYSSSSSTLLVIFAGLLQEIGQLHDVVPTPRKKQAMKSVGITKQIPNV